MSIASQRGHSIAIGIVGVVGILIIVALVVVFVPQYTKVQQQKARITAQTDATKERAGQIQRDKVRHQHAMTLASRLSAQILVAKGKIAPGQAGLDSIAKNGDTLLADPSTDKPYVFAATQRAMKVGEATFRASASCDDKVAGADGKGMIVDASDSSVAVAIKLESGGYACETNL